MVMVYDPGSPADVAAIGQIDKDPVFAAAARYCNLVRVDRQGVRDTANLKEVAPAATLLIYCGERHRMSLVTGRDLAPRELVSKLRALIAHEWGRPGDEMIAEMQQVLEKREALSAEAKKLEPKAIDPATGAREPSVTRRLVAIQAELDAGNAREAALLVRPKGTRHAGG